MKAILLGSRFKSFYWRTAMMVVALVVGQFATNIDLLTGVVSPQTTILLGLVLGEISKALNNALGSGNK